MTYTAKAREIAQTAFKTFIDNIAVMVSCPRCDGVGHHHGFGEDGMDPDWCSKCGGNQSVEKYTDEEAFVLAIEQALTLIGTEREAIGYEKGKEEAAKVAEPPVYDGSPAAALRDSIAQGIRSLPAGVDK